MKRRRLTLSGLLIGLVFLSFLLPIKNIPATAQGNGTTERVSVASDGSQGNQTSYWPSISADGRYIAFFSNASNLVNGDTNNWSDVFVHDRQTNQTIRVSVASNGTQGDYRSESPSISTDGRYIAFECYSSNMVSGDTNQTTDICVHDQQTGQTTRVSVASDGSQSNYFSRTPAISGNGRFVAFESSATTLVIGDTNNKPDIFVHDRQTSQTSRVSISSTGAQGNNSSEGPPSISADGRYVVFHSSASNLVVNDTNSTRDVFIHDRQTGQTARVSINSNGSQINNWSTSPAISADGRYVGFVSLDGTIGGNVFIHDRQTSQTTLIAHWTSGGLGNNYEPHISLSADGRYVVYKTINGQVYLYDQQTGQTTLISAALDSTQGNGFSRQPSISADGRYVAFSSDATNLVNGDTNGYSDVFVRDRGAEPTYSISGRVTDNAGNPIAGVTVSAGGGGSVTTNSNGDYSLGGLVAGSYTVTPSKGGYTFNPASRSVSVPPDSTGKDFNGYDKPPLVFVHGWSGFPPWGSCEWPNPDTYFESVDQLLHASGYYTTYAQLETSACFTPPLLDNVPRLRNAILQAKNVTNQPKVILIAHSMGGLVSRAYIEGPDYADDVAALFTFGSPHRGISPDLLTFLVLFANGASLGYYCEHNQPAVCDFSALGMTLFNNSHSPRTTEVNYHFISGNAPYLSRNLLGKTMDVVIGGILGPDDGITPTDSGLGFGLLGAFDRFETDENHNIFGSRSYFIRDGGQSISYAQCLKKVLVDKTSANCGSLSTQQIIAQDTPNLSEHTPFLNGRILAGQMVVRTISVEGGPTLFVAQWVTGTLLATLIDPNGQIINPAYAASNPNIVTYNTDANIATYYFPNPDKPEPNRF